MRLSNDATIELANASEPLAIADAALSAQMRRLAVLVLAAFALVTCFLGLNHGPPMGDHECINALAARQAIASGEWFIPHVGEIPWIRKPPLGTWLIAASSLLVDDPAVSLPVTDYSARLPSAAAAWGTVLLVCWLGAQMYGFRAGFAAGFVTAGCVATIFFAHNAQVDMVLTFLTTLAYACFWRGAVHDAPSRWALPGCYLAFSLAMTAKAPLPLVTVGLGLVVYWFVTVPLVAATGANSTGTGSILQAFHHSLRTQCRRLRDLWVLPGLLVFLLVAGAWPVYVLTQVEGGPALWKAEFIDRFTGDMAERGKAVWYYLPISLGLTAPYMASLPEAVAAPFLPRYRSHRKGLAFALTWAFVGIAFLSASEFKRPHYMLSIVPAFCLLLGPVIDQLFFGAAPVARRATQWTCRFLPLVIAAAAVVGGLLVHRTYPDLLRSYLLAAGLGGLAWIAACRAYARDCRWVSFALLNLGVLLVQMAIWPGLRSGLDLNAESRALIQALQAHDITPDDSICWVDGRPDASVEFYGGFRIRRLINEIEMTSFRARRNELPVRLYAEFAARIRRWLDSAEPAYLIIKGEHLSMLEQRSSIDYRVVFRLTGYHRSEKDELVVITQSANPEPPGPVDGAVPSGALP